MATIGLTETVMSRPDDLIPEDQKDRQWILNYIRWCWYNYAQVPQTMFFGARGLYQELQDYSQGKQSIDKYKPQLNIDAAASETWMNINWDVIPIFPKYLSVALGKVNEVDYNIVATPINSMAEDEKNEKFADLKAKILIRKALSDMGSKSAGRPELQPNEKEPKDLRELEIMFDFTYKNDMAVEMEESIQLVNYQNDIYEIRKTWKEHIAKYGVAGFRQYIDSNGAIRLRAADPEKIIVSKCSKKDFSDKKYCGEVIELTIGELKQMAQGQFSAQEYQDIAKNVMGNYGNPNQVPENVEFVDWYESCKIWVLDCYFYSVNELLNEEFTDKRGNKFIGNAYVDKSGKLRGELRRTSYRVVYKGCWIIGTNYMYNYGLETNMARSEDSLGDCEMPFRLYCPDFYKMRTVSLAEKVMGIVDQIQLDWYHLQNIKNQAKPKGIEIELGALENVNLGANGERWTPRQVLDLFNQTGTLVWRRINSLSGNQELRPLQELDNGVGKDAEFYFNSILQNINLLREMIGLNEFTDASTPNARATNSLAQLATEGTAKALSFIIEADKYLLEKSAYTTILFLQDLVSMGADVSGYVRSLGGAVMKFVQLSDKVSNYEYGIMLEERPTDQERMQFMAEAQKALDRDQVRYSDLVMVKSIDNLKMARMVLAYKMDEYAAQKQNNALQLQQANGNVQVQSATAAEQAKQQTLQVDYEYKMKLIQLENDLKLRNDAVKFQHEKDLKQMDNNAEVVSTLIQTDSKETINGQNIQADKENLAHQDANKVLAKTGS